jgi:hypothetical protein
MPAPSQGRMNALGNSIRRAMAGAEDTFDRILRINPGAVPIMRRYAQYLEEVRCKHCTVRLARLGSTVVLPASGH